MSKNLESNKTNKPPKTNGAMLRATKGDAASRSSAAFATQVEKASEEVRNFAVSLDLGDALATNDRRRLAVQSNRVSDAMIEAMISVSVAHGGLVAGAPFDVDAAREVLARATALRGFVQWMKEITGRASDDVTRRRSAVAIQVMQRYALLEALVKNPEGAAMRGELDRMRAMMKVRRSTKAAKAPVTAPPTTPSTALAPQTGGATKSAV